MTMVEIMETSEYKNIDSRVVTDGLKLCAIGLLMIFSFFIFDFVVIIIEGIVFVIMLVKFIKNIKKEISYINSLIDRNENK